MKPRVVFMGTPDFAVPTLRHLAEAGFPVAAVVTQPDRPAGRGYAESQSAVKRAALTLGLTVLQPASVNEPGFLQTLAGYSPDAVVVAAFGQILKPALLGLPPLGCLNLHASLLPKYRGAAPIQWAVARGERETGVTVQRMVLQVDAGDVLAAAATPIGPDETGGELFVRLAELGAPVMARALEALAAAGGRGGVPQDEARATFAPRLTREDARLDWTWPGAELHNRVRGFSPWPGAQALALGQPLKILRTAVSAEGAADAAPGTLIRVEDPRGWLVAAGDRTTVWVGQVQSAGKKPMPAAAFSRGRAFGAGARLE